VSSGAPTPSAPAPGAPAPAGIGGLYGLRRLREPGFQRLVLVLVAVLLALFRLTQFAVFTTQIQWGYDFSAYWTAAGHLLHGLPIYAADQLSGPYAPQRQFLYLYPPPLAAVFTPLAALVPGDYRAAMWAWWAIDMAILVVGSLAVAGSIGLFERVRAATGLGPWILVLAVLCFPPVVGELVLGNVHILLFGLFAVAWLGLRQGDRAGERWSGIAVGIAAVIKVFPALVILWFLLTGRRKAAAWSVIGAFAFIALTLPFTGIGPWLDFPAALLNLSAPSDTTDTLAPTVWLAGFIGFGWARIVITGLALAILAWTAHRVPTRRGFVVAVLLSVLVAPALYHHYLAILVLPFLLLLAEDGALPWLGLAYLLMSGGEQTALGDLSWIVNRGLPTAGSLILLGVAVLGRRRVANPRPGPAEPGMSGG
jgi:alpha-1,2-mannosyltransferase